MSNKQGGKSVSWNGWLDKALEFISLLGAAALMVGMCIIVFDVIRRSVQGVSLQGSLDIVRLCVTTCAFLSIPLLFLREKNVAVEFPTDGLPPRWLAILRGMVVLISGGFMAAIFVFGLGTARQQVANGDMSQTLGIPVFWYWLPFVVGAGLGVIATLILAIRCFFRLSEFNYKSEMDVLVTGAAE